MSDGVIHAAFNHDFSKFAENAEADRRAIKVMGDGLAGSERSLIVTAGLQQRLGWHPTQETWFIADLDRSSAFRDGPH